MIKSDIKKYRLFILALLIQIGLPAQAAYKNHLMRFKDVADAYFCKAIYENLTEESPAPRDEQSKKVEAECKTYVEENAEIKELSLAELSEAMSILIQGESRETINFTLRALQDDFLAAEGVYPKAPHVIWNASASLLKDLSTSLGVYLEEQNQRLANGKTDLALQALHGAFIVMSVSKGGQIGYKTIRSGYFGWRTLGPDFSSRSMRGVNLALRGFGDSLLRLPKNMWIMTKDTAGGVKQIVIKSLAAVRNPTQSMGAARDLLVRGAKGSYAYAVSSVSQNRGHLLAGGVGGISYATYMYLQQRILDPNDFLDEALVAAFDQLHNEWEALYAISKAANVVEIEKIAKDIGLSSKDDLNEVWLQTNAKYVALKKLAKGRNLNLPFDLFRNSLDGSYEKIWKLAKPVEKPVKVVTPVAPAKNSKILDQEAAAALKEAEALEEEADKAPNTEKTEASKNAPATSTNASPAKALFIDVGTTPVIIPKEEKKVVSPVVETTPVEAAPVKTEPAKVAPVKKASPAKTKPAKAAPVKKPRR